MNNNEETILDAQGAQNENNNDMPETTNPNHDNPANKKQGGKNLKGAIIGTAGAAAIGGAALLITGFKKPEEPVEEPVLSPDNQTTPIAEPLHFNGAEVPLANGVNDNMSFSEAFATAREEVGPGGVFHWHGASYGTYYENEWHALSPDYQQAFSNYHYSFPVEEENLSPLQPQPEHFGEHRVYTDDYGNQFILLADLSGNEIRVNPENLQYVILDDNGAFIGVTNENVLFPDDMDIYPFDDVDVDNVTIIEPDNNEDEITTDDPADNELDTLIAGDDATDEDMLPDFDNNADISNFV